MPQRDPITRMQMFLLREGILDEKGINKIEKEVEERDAGRRRSRAGSAVPAAGVDTEVFVFAGSGSDIACI